MNYPKISIVTPSYNQSKYLEETINSVISQDYPNLEYIIIDGGSTDGTVEIIRKYEKHLAFWVSEKDNGMYHALQKGFGKSTGDIMGWINSDDLLHRKSLFVLSNIFLNNNDINWIQGRPTVYDESGMIVDVHPAVYSKYHFYLKQYTSGAFIQQESTFWRRSLWTRAGSRISTDYQYAGDFELWIRFFAYELLHYTDALIGGYRVSSNQLSRLHTETYLSECSAIVDAVKLSEEESRVIKLLKQQKSPMMQKRFIGRLLRRFVKSVPLYQQPVKFDFENGKFYH